MSIERRIFKVDPDRLRWGEWSHESHKTIGEGDIRASYSADRIGLGKSIRPPFRHRGDLWVSVCTRGPGSNPEVEAYRLMHATAYSGTPTTYAEKTREAEAARKDPLGFYHGMTVRCRGEEWVLCGPPCLFVADERSQFDLFAAAVDRQAAGRRT